jgi:tetratricopeptide (TPR) repeat protein
MYKALLLLAFFAASLLTLHSCKTADGRLTKIGKGYHNLTGRYNAYYHAGLRLEKAHQTIRSQYKDNFNELLPLYPYVANTDTTSIRPPLEEAIKKLAMNIELHRPSNWADDSYLMLGQVEFLKKQYPKSAETFQYIVDKYNPDKPKSAMSKEEIAELNKKNKKEAKKKKQSPAAKKKAATKKKKTAAKKKKASKKKSSKKKSAKKKAADVKKKAADKKAIDDKKIADDKKVIDDKNNTNNTAKNEPNGEPDGEPEPEIKPKRRNRLKHQPNRHTAMLWLAKAYIETKQYDDAGLFLRQLGQDVNTPKRLRSEIKAVEAHLFISQQEYAKAIEPLEEAIKRCHRRRTKSRYVYVLAQLYQKQNNPQLAYQNYRRVIKLKPNYEMDLNARLAAAKTAAQAGDTKANPELAMRRMLRDEKNDEYKDQIYFALAEIQLRNGDTDEGIVSLQKSLAAGKSGPQRVEASLLLANLYYDKKDYVPAFLYYDSTSQIIDKKDGRSTEVVARRRQLELFATNTLDLEANDSLLKLSLLPYEEQKAYAQRLRKEQTLASGKVDATNKNAPVRPLTFQEKAAMGGRTANKGTDPSGAKPTVSDNVLASSTFALYNPSQQKKGEKDFEKRWGSRPWVDNWRSSRALEDNPNASTTKGATAIQPMTEEETKTFLTQLGIPLDDKGRDELRKKIATNLLNIGTAEQEQLLRSERAIVVLNRLVEQYPTSPQALEGLYILYNIYKQDNNTAKAEATKALILQHHPNSDIAKTVQNPSFLNARQAKEKDLNSQYQAAYEAVRKGQFQEAITKINAAQSQFGDSNAFKARFALLMAMCEGGTKGEEDYIKALRVVSTSFPNTAEDKKAKEMLAILTKGSNGGGSNPSNPSNPTNTEGAFKFTENKNSGHYVLVVFDDVKIKMDPIRTPIDNFNRDAYSALRLNVASLMVENTIPAITIRKFANAEQALNYRSAALANKKYLGDTPPSFNIYVVGQDNYRALLQPPFGKFNEYIIFHKQFYNID